jgi:hypothetical protein
MIDRVDDIRDIMKKQVFIMNAFKKLDVTPPSYECIKNVSDGNYNINTICRNENTIDGIDEAIMAPPVILTRTLQEFEKIINSWEYYVRLDIMNRLYLIAYTHFTLDQLKFLDVDLKKVSDLENMNLTTLIAYYVKAVKQIRMKIKRLIILCKMYIDIEIDYAKCCSDMANNLPTHLTLNVDVIEAYAKI